MMVPSAGMSELTLSAVFVWLIQKLKNSKYFPWLQMETAKANRIASMILAGLGAAGLQWSWDPAHHALMISNLTFAVIGAAIWHWLQHFVLQETIYRVTLNKASAPEIRTAVTITPDTKTVIPEAAKR